MSDPKSRQEMLGEYAREASVLILVFGLLDPVFHDPTIPASMRSSLAFVADFEGKIHAGYWYGAVLAGSLVLLMLGMRLERRR